MATIIAMIAPMKIVPQNKGIEPNAPDEPAWSARIATCGLHDRPNRNSSSGTSLKKRRDSKSSERMIPSVVKIAISDATRSNPFIHLSTAVRARNSRSRLRSRMIPALPSATRIAAIDPIEP